MSFCKVGEKAYLRVNDSEVWAFDGPISVKVQQKQSETFYPNIWFWSFKAIVYGYDASIAEFYYHTVDDTGEKYANMWIDCPVALTNYGTVSPWYTPFNPPRYAIGTPVGFGDRSVNVNSINRQLQRKKPAFHSWVRKGARGWWASGGHNEQPIPGGIVYELLVNGTIIKTSPNPIDYIIRCGDRCPPGTAWNERCKTCVCDDMGAIKAGLRSATAIARSIKK